MTISQDKQQMQESIHKLIFKAFYFFFLSSFYTRLIYFPLYLKQLGLSASYVGILAGVIPFVRGVGAPILGYVADRTKLRKAVFLLSVSAHTLLPVLLLIPRPDEPTCQSTVAMEARKYAYNRTNFTLDINNNFYFSNKSLPSRRMFNPPNEAGREEINLGQSEDMFQVFLALLVLSTVCEFIAAPAKGLIDSALLETLEKDTTSYGKFRLWGNIGQIILYLISTLISKANTVTMCNIIVQDDSALAMFPVAVAMIGAFAVGLNIPFKQDEMETTKYGTLKTQKIFLKDFLLTYRIIAFLIIVLYTGVVCGVFTNFMFWHLSDVSPSQTTWIVGVAGVSRNITSVVSLQLSGSVIRKIGVMNTIHLTLSIHVLACFMFGLLTNPWLAIVPEVMEEICISLSLPASFVYISENSPDKYSATMQSILYACYLGLGYGAGAVTGGFLMDIIGGSRMFLMFGGVTVMLMAFSLFNQSTLTLLDRSRKLQDDADSLEEIETCINHERDKGTVK